MREDQTAKIHLVKVVILMQDSLEMTVKCFIFHTKTVVLPSAVVLIFLSEKPFRLET